jgi:hypothetical protein
MISLCFCLFSALKKVSGFYALTTLAMVMTTDTTPLRNAYFLPA